MKQVNILTFGVVTDITGLSNFVLNDIDNTDNLVDHLEKKYPLLKTIKYNIAVDKKVINDNTVLHQNAIVAILPPFSGG